MPIDTPPKEMPVDLPEPWATWLREIASEHGVSPEEMLIRLASQQLELRQAAKRLCFPWLASPPKG